MSAFRFGFKAAISRRHTKSRTTRRKLAIEPLESRRLLVGTLSFDGGHVFDTADFTVYGMSVGNLNSDPFLDAVVTDNNSAGTSSRLRILTGNSSGLFAITDTKQLPFIVEQSTVGDYNGDNRQDVLVSYSQLESNRIRSYIRILAGRGDGTVTDPIDPLYVAGESLVAIAFADFDGDGRADLLTSGQSFGLLIKHGNGDGTFTTVLSDSNDTSTQDIQVVDVNGDGRKDIVYAYVRNSVGLLGIKIRNVDGTFQSTRNRTLQTFPNEIATGDFNEDGKVDFAVAESVPAGGPNNGVLEVLLSDGGGNITQSSFSTIATNTGGLVVADFDLDFHLDVAVGNQLINGVQNATVLVFQGNGTGSLLPPVAGVQTTDSSRNLYVTDFNRDGKPDLLARINSGSALATFFNTATIKSSIRGLIWNDTNRNAILDAGESPVSGRTVWADQNDNNQIDAGEQTAVTDGRGIYELLVPGGTYKVRQQLPVGWIQTINGDVPGKTPYAYSVTVLTREIRGGWNLPTYFLGNVAGKVFNDFNANQVFDVYESGLPGRTIYADLNNNGAIDANEPSDVTASDGSFHFQVSPGTYLIREVPVAGWFVTKSSAATVTVTASSAAYGLAFGRTRLGGIAGTIYNDDLQLGYKTDSDVGIAGVRVYLDTSNDDTYNPPTGTFAGEPTAITDANGHYQISNLFPGAYQVRIVKPSGRTFTQPVSVGNADAFYDTVANGGFDGANTNFGLIFPAYVTGNLFDDLNRNGIISAGESGLANISVAIDYNVNGTADLYEPIVLTNSNGDYRLTSSRPGNFPVIIIPPSGRTATAPSSGSRTVNFVQGQTVSGQNFGLVTGAFSNAPYLPPINIPTGSNPVSLAAGDFNGDGIADVVVANNASPGQIFLGNGDGLFTTGIDFFIGSATRFMVSADFNRDGKLDVVAANQDDNGVSILIGNGDGTFRTAVNYAAASGAYGVAVADFNNDGLIDLVVTGVSDSNFGYLQGNGDGTFRNVIAVPTNFGGKSIAAGDVDGDGKIDLVIANQNSSVISLHRGNGNGNFNTAIPFAAGANQPDFVTLADVNADSRLDLVFINEFSNQVVVRLGIGTADFISPKTFATVSGPQQLAVIDVDKDGIQDLIVSGRSDGTTDISGGVSILRGRGDGTYLQQLISTAHTSPTAVAIADFNRDNKLDIVVANFFSSDLSLLLNGTANQLGQVSGFVYRDDNADGVRQAGELGLPGRTVFADQNSNSKLDPGERFTLSTNNGSYVLTNLAAGTQKIRVVSTADFVQTGPTGNNASVVNVVPNQPLTRSFGLAPTAREGGIVLDNQSAKLVGAWSAQTTQVGFLGTNYLSDGNAGKGTKSATFSPLFQFDGYYEVAVRWTAASTNATNVPIDIKSDSGTRNVVVNERANGGKWVSLGTYFFKQNGGAVTFNTTGTNGSVIVDAARFVSVPTPPTIVRDNADAGVVIAGSWSALTNATTQQYGTNYLIDTGAATSSSVTFSSGPVAAAGVYELFAWWVSGINRATNARIEVTSATGVKTLSLNQQKQGGQWVSLGFYDLSAIGGSIKISNQGADGKVVADAVKFVRVS